QRAVETDVVPACQNFGVGLLPYFPLANGLLTGKYRQDNMPAGARLADERWATYVARVRWDVIDKIEAYAQERALSMLDVAIGGLAAKPSVTPVIAGATTPDQVRATAAAAAWQPSADDLAQLDAIPRRH